MKVGIAYTTKYKADLIAQTLPRIALNPAYDLHIVDGSDDVWRPASKGVKYYEFHPGVKGGADAAIAYSLSLLLAHPARYTHVGIVEMDVLLDEDWYAPTVGLFEKGEADGLHVGAVSARSYVDRVLIQKDGYAICHNLGAGMVIFTREAAEIILRTFRTGWWPDIRKTFGQVSGIDIGTFACFGVNEQWVTSDWLWDSQLARHGLASIALTPAKCQMIGQNPPLEQQGLVLTTGPVEARRDDGAFDYYAATLDDLWDGTASGPRASALWEGSHGRLYFPHHLARLDAKLSGWKLKWNQGFGPFNYQAGTGGASLSMRISGSCSFLVNGGVAGGRVEINDELSGFKANPNLPPSDGQMVEVPLPGGVVPRRINATFEEGTLLCGINCADPQIERPYSFTWEDLPEPA